MSIHKAWFFVLVLASSLSPIHVLANGSSLHGGSAVVCRNPSGGVIEAQLLDIAEARYMGWKLKDANTPVEVLLTEARIQMERIDRVFAVRTDSLINSFRRKFYFLPSSSLEPVYDVGPVRTELRPDCGIEQLGTFHDGMVLISREIFDRLDNLNQAAFLIHEAVYHIHRGTDDAMPYSSTARELTGMLFSKGFSLGEYRTLMGVIGGRRTDTGYYRPEFVESDSSGCKLHVGLLDVWQQGDPYVELRWFQDEQISRTCERANSRDHLRLDTRTGHFIGHDRGLRLQFVSETIVILTVQGYSPQRYVLASSN